MRSVRDRCQGRAEGMERIKAVSFVFTSSFYICTSLPLLLWVALRCGPFFIVNRNHGFLRGDKQQAIGMKSLLHIQRGFLLLFQGS